MKKVVSFLGLVAVVGAGGCDFEQKSTRNCTYNGSERFGITVDGRFRGAFETYIPAEGPHGIAFFRNGLIPAAADLRNAPDQAKDVTVFALDKGKVTQGVADLVETRFISLSGLPSKDDSGCIVVDEIAVDVGETQTFTGVLTSRPSAASTVDAGAPDTGPADAGAADTGAENDED